MNKTEIKTRNGLLLEGCLAKAFELVGTPFEQSFQYDDACEVPDFLIPDGKRPKWMIEVHQTETRDSLRMKTLRAFTAVCECKGNFGHRLATVNLVFGNTGKTFASSPMASLGAIFDATILPRDDRRAADAILKVEAKALACAKKDKLNVEKAVSQIVHDMPEELSALGKSVKLSLQRVAPIKGMEHLWRLEEERRRSLVESPKAGEPTYFKRAVLKTLFLTDNDFEEWVASGDFEQCSPRIQAQAILCGIAEKVDGLTADQDTYTNSKEVSALLRSGEIRNMRALAAKELNASSEMRDYFADVREGPRRNKLAHAFAGFLKLQSGARFKALTDSLQDPQWGGVSHSRNCLFDFISLVTSLSFNDFNSAIFEDKRYPISLWSPYSNLVLRLGQFGRISDASVVSCAIVNETLDNAIETGLLIPREWSCDRLSKVLAEFRVFNSIKLRKLDPLRAKVRAVCSSLNLTLKRISLENILFDLAADAGVGRFLIYEVRNESTGRHVLLNAVAVHDGHGDDKSKEWGARRLATLYRMEAGKIRTSEYQEGIFVLDGEWKDKDVARLHRSGWNYIVRLADLEKTLRSAFGIKSAKKTTPANLTPISFTEDDEDLAMAAEDNTPRKLTKRRESNGR